jgi:hypothetical protein
MAENRGKIVKQLREAGFRLKKSGAKADYWEYEGIVVTLGSGSGSSGSDKFIETLKTSHRIGRKFTCYYCAGQAKKDIETGKLPNLSRDPEHLATYMPNSTAEKWLSHVAAKHPNQSHYFDIVRRRLGLLPRQSKPKKNYEFWLSRFEEIVNSDYYESRDVIGKMNHEGYRTPSKKVMDANRFWSMLDEVNRRRAEAGKPQLAVMDDRPKPELPPSPIPETTAVAADANANLSALIAEPKLDIPEEHQRTLDSLDTPERKLHFLRAVAKLPVSVELLLDDPELAADRKLEVVLVVLRRQS